MLLVLSIAFLFIAPLLNLLCSKKDYVFSSLHGFVFVILATLIGIDIIPELIDNAGTPVYLFLLLGLLLPFVTENVFQHSHLVHKSVLLIGILGLLIHVLADGAVLAENEPGTNLAFAVAVHRIPIGLFVWWYIKPNFGSTVAYLILSIIATGTIIGYELADWAFSTLHVTEITYFQAFVVGSLIHVLFHKPPFRITCSSRRSMNRYAESFGNVLGLLCVFYLLEHTTHQQTENETLNSEMVNTFSYLAYETAPMLLLAIISAGLIKAFLPDSFVNWIKHGKSWQQAFKGMLVGLPIPICSCSIIPLYHSLINKRVPPSAAMAFLIATPELGIDALLISLPLLGAELTFARLISAVILAFLVGMLASRFAATTLQNLDEPMNQCCTRQNNTFFKKIQNGISYSLHEVLDHIAPWILIGIALAALIQPIIGNLDLESITPMFQVLIFATLGIPVYVCASSSTPFVAILLMNGVSPGAGMAFLLAGPATNISTFGVLAKLHNFSTALFLITSCFAISVSLGIAVNLFFSGNPYVSLIDFNHQHTWVHELALYIMAILLIYTIFRKGLRSFLLELAPQPLIQKNPVCTHDH